MSPAAKLCGFLILLAVAFTAAHAAGARLGPVTTGHGGPENGPAMNMNVGGAAPGAGRPAAGPRR
jgi:hypothetical protein